MSTVRRRLDHVDLLRGLVMVIMVLDHVRDYFTVVRFDPTDLTRTDLALFATRWITHYCAPVFIFLAGASASIAGAAPVPTGGSARFLLSRGLWLILLEVTVISFGWYFSTRWPVGARAQVIWAIGASMVVLAGLIRLPRTAVAASASRWWWAQPLDGVAAVAFGAFAPLWHVLHVRFRSASCPYS